MATSLSLQEPALRSLDLSHKRYRRDTPVMLAALSLVLLLSFAYGMHIKLHGMIMPSQAMDICMGFYYLVFGIPKILTIKSFSMAFQKYNIVAKKLPMYSLIYPVIEIVLGIMYLTVYNTLSLPHAALYSSLVVLTSFVNAASILHALRTKYTGNCACLGGKFATPASYFLVCESLIMALMGVLMLKMLFTMAA